MLRRASALGIAALGVALGVLTLDVARDDPGYGFAGSSRLAGAALLLAGWALIGMGVALWLRRPDSRVGPLLALAGFAWFAPEWNNPGAGTSLAFTAGVVLSAACPPLVAHAVLAYPAGRLDSRTERAALACAYACALVVLGAAPALWFDPAALGCNRCSSNLLVLGEWDALSTGLTDAGVYLGVAWGLVLTVLAVRRLRRAAMRPVAGPGAVYLALVALSFAVAVDRGFLSTGTLQRRLWLGQAAALVGVAGGMAWTWVRARRARSEVAQLVVDLARSPPPGGLRDVLARMAHDPGLVVAYPVDDSGRMVDAQGREVELPEERQRTPVVHDGRTLAVLAHAPGAFDDDQLVEEVTAAARLALENERLQAEVRSRLEDIRASRARIVATGDAERKHLERDLHDGAQQRLVALALSLRLLRNTAPESTALQQAERELGAAIEELRELAHGIFPAVLADDGLDAAVHALAEESRVPLRIGVLPDRRFRQSAETAAYTLVAATVRAAGGAVAVRALAAGGVLAVELEAEETNGLDVVALEDRVGALDGRLDIARTAAGTTTIRAELPCES